MGQSINSFLIREATTADLPGILTIFNDAILNTTAIYEYKTYTITDIQNWFSEKQAKSYPVLVYETGNTIAGFASYGQFRVRAGYKYAAEHSVYVHQDFRKKGIARLLLLELFRIAEANNIHTLIAGIDAENVVSISFHKQLGFEQCGYIKEAAYKFGRWLDLVFMQLILKTPQHPTED